MYEILKKIQTLLWKDDDRMDQDTLFELQDYVSEIILNVAKQENRMDDLVQKFPWLYED